MKKILTILILFIGFVAHAQLIANPTEVGGDTAVGQRLEIVTASSGTHKIDFYGLIGLNAVELSLQNSYQDGSSDHTINTRADGRGATGTNSVAMGLNTWAAGNNSTAIGDGTVAYHFGSLAIGSYNEIGEDGSQTAVDIANILFSIGNGTAEIDRSNAFSVDKAGNTTMGDNLTIGSYTITATNAAKLDILANRTALDLGRLARVDNGQATSGLRLFSGGDHVTAPGTFSVDLSTQTASANLHPDVSGQSLKGGAVGNSSIAMGNHVLATGERSTAMGHQTYAEGENSTAMGASARAEGNNSTAMGSGTHALGVNSTAMGSGAVAYDDNSLAIGGSNGMTQASSGTKTAFVIGDGNAKTVFKVLFDGNTTMAGDATITGNASMADAAISGDATIGGTATIGGNTTINTDLSLAVASNDATISNTAEGDIAITTTKGNISLISTTEYSGTNVLSKIEFVNVDANPIINVTGALNVTGDVVVNSDMRLKANIISLGSTLYKLLQIDGKTYTMKRDATKKQKIGVLAQDIEKVFPELVVESNGIKSVNYQGLVPVLINSIKEQDAKISRLEKLVEKLISNK